MSCSHFSLYQHWLFSRNPFSQAMLSSEPLKHYCVTLGAVCQPVFHIQMQGALPSSNHFPQKLTLVRINVHASVVLPHPGLYYLFRHINNYTCLFWIYVAPNYSSPLSSRLSLCICLCSYSRIRLASLFMTSASIFCHTSLHVHTV